MYKLLSGGKYQILVKLESNRIKYARILTDASEFIPFHFVNYNGTTIDPIGLSYSSMRTYLYEVTKGLREIRKDLRKGE